MIRMTLNLGLRMKLLQLFIREYELRLFILHFLRLTRCHSSSIQPYAKIYYKYIALSYFMKTLTPKYNAYVGLTCTKVGAYKKARILFKHCVSNHIAGSN